MKSCNISKKTFLRSYILSQRRRLSWTEMFWTVTNIRIFVILTNFIIFTIFCKYPSLKYLYCHRAAILLTRCNLISATYYIWHLLRSSKYLSVLLRKRQGLTFPPIDWPTDGSGCKINRTENCQYLTWLNPGKLLL